MPTNPETGKEFLARAIAALPVDLRSQAETIFNAPEATSALDFVGQGVKRQDDYSRQMDEVRTMQSRARADSEAAQALAARVREVEAQQVEWWNQNRAALESATPGTPAPAAAQPVPANVITEDRFNATLQEALGVIGWSSTVSARHMQTFNEVLDVPQIIAEATSKKISLEQAYREHFQTQYQERATKLETERVAKIKADAVAEFRAQNPNIPYPVPSSSGASADTLGGLTGDKSHYGPEAAAAEYNRLIAARSA